MNLFYVPVYLSMYQWHPCIVACNMNIGKKRPVYIKISLVSLQAPRPTKQVCGRSQVWQTGHATASPNSEKNHLAPTSVKWFWEANHAR